jgi:hypothetical protein
MKLNHVAVFVAVGAFACGCASGQVQPPVASNTVTSADVSTTHLDAAVAERKAAPKVGKLQRSPMVVEDAESAVEPKAEPRRRGDDDRRRGGFSGWK